MKKHLLIILLLGLILGMTFWFICVVILTRQIFLLGLISLCCTMLSAWGIWYTFLKKKYIFMGVGGLVFLISILLLILAILDITNPVDLIN